MTRALPVALLAALLLALPAALPARLADGAFSAVAWADDDDDGGGGGDDDDDDGDDDDDDDGGRTGDDDDDDGGARPAGSGDRDRGIFGTLFGTPRQPGPAPAPSVPPPPAAAPGEIVTLALGAADLGTLLGLGFTVIEERQLPGVDGVARRLSVPPALTPDEALEVTRALPGEPVADFNHYYRTDQAAPAACPGAGCPAGLPRGWPYGLPRDRDCGAGAPIGMIDTGINADHEVLAGARLELTRLGRDGLDPSRAIHGTAVAALLVGQPGTRAPGLVPRSRLVAVDAFHRVGRDERADVFSLLEGLDLLASEGVSVINLSLSGPPNAVLEDAVARLVIQADIVLTAAVGNAGPAADPAYPAAYGPVIAVTAVDRDGTIHRRAVRGAHVDLAAPGVEVWTAASVSGARWITGTSFAVPFVTAAAALLRRSRPDLPAAEVQAVLRDMAHDIGEPGVDDVFGAGLVNLDALCPDPS